MNQLARIWNARAADNRHLTEIYRRGDRLISWLLAAHVVLAFGMAFAYETWLVTFTLAPLALSIFLVPRMLAPGRLVTRVAAGIALQVFVALHIYQFHGMAEQHFWFFTATTAMIVYQDALAMWPGVLLIIAQHILFAGLHNSGVELFFFEEPRVGMVKLSFHFGVALSQAFLATALAVNLRKHTTAEGDLREELVVARQGAEAAAQARGAFLANMSHEIRTPMNGIEGMADALLASELDGDQRECSETIRSSSRALLSIIGDVLDFSKIESGKLDLTPRPFQVRKLVAEVVRLLEPKAAAHSVDVHAEVAPEVPEWIVADGNRVRQVLFNLAGNGVKFSPEGSVQIAVFPDSEAGREGLRIVITDTGIGMSEEQLSRVFSPFEQASSDTSVRFGGTGLGLSITRRLVECMSGTLEISTAPGRGTTVAVRFSAPVAAPQDVRSNPPKSTDTSGLSVLVVEDNKVNQRVAKRLLELLGCKVTIANDGIEALAAKETGAFDLVLMDCLMPRLDGFQTTERWRAIELDLGQEPTPIVALTASALGEDHERCRSVGMQDCLTKPVSLDALREALGASAASA